MKGNGIPGLYNSGISVRALVITRETMFIWKLTNSHLNYAIIVVLRRNMLTVGTSLFIAFCSFLGWPQTRTIFAISFGLWVGAGSFSSFLTTSTRLTASSPIRPFAVSTINVSWTLIWKMNAENIVATWPNLISKRIQKLWIIWNQTGRYPLKISV